MAGGWGDIYGGVARGGGGGRGGGEEGERGVRGERGGSTTHHCLLASFVALASAVLACARDARIPVRTAGIMKSCCRVAFM